MLGGEAERLGRSVGQDNRRFPSRLLQLYDHCQGGNYKA
jgi:hypothetical protein